MRVRLFVADALQLFASAFHERVLFEGNIGAKNVNGKVADLLSLEVYGHLAARVT